LKSADIAPWFKQAFHWVQNAAAGRIGDGGELDRLHEAFRLADSVYQPILAANKATLIQKTRAISALEQKIADRNSTAAQTRHAQAPTAALAVQGSKFAARLSPEQELAAALAERDSILATQLGREQHPVAGLAERDSMLLALTRSSQALTGALSRVTALFEQQVAERDAALAARVRYGQELEKELADLRSALEAQERREEKLTADLAEHAGREQELIAQRQALAAVYASTSWRVTAPLRWGGRRLRRLRQILGRVSRVTRRVLATRSTTPLKLWRSARVIAKSHQLDPAWYVATYPDVASVGLDPIEHYLAYGAAENRNPSPHFDTAAYLLANPDVAGSGINPLVHFILHGQAEGRGKVDIELPASQARPTRAAEIRSSFSPSSAYETFDPSIVATAEPVVDAIAFYLPQFHSIAENDAWWGAGFTEWRNVVRGAPRFAGHYQPRIPRDLGFYDLTHPDVMRRQIELAKAAGLRGFCFYFYWFDGRRLLDKPVDAFLADASLDIPFCIMWANENWTRRWDGFESDVLMAQSYADQDEGRLLDEFHRHFSDSRYIRVEGRPLLLIYRPGLVPNAAETFQRWREHCLAAYGYTPLVLGVLGFGMTEPKEHGLDGLLEFPPHFLAEGLTPITAEFELLDPHFKGHVFDYEDVVQRSLERAAPDYPLIRTVMPSWDNDARRQGTGAVYHGSTPQKYEHWLREIAAYSTRNPTWNRSFVFINAWNEWAEAAYLEPDIHYGSAYLNATARAVTSSPATERFTSILLIGQDAHNHGAQRNLRAMGEVLARRFGMEVEFVLLEGGPLLQSYEQIASCSVLSVPLAESALSNFRRLHAEGYRRAIVNTTVSGKVVPAAKSVGLQLLSLVHELPGLIKDYGLEAAARSIAQHSDVIVFAGANVRDKFRALSGAASERCQVRPQGLYRTEISADPSARARVRTELGIPAAARIVLGVGYADMRKGFDLFVQTAELLSSQPDIYFVWIGNIAHDMRKWYPAALKPGQPAPRLLAPGRREDVRDYYNAADVFLLTSREDPFPSVVLEAFATGLPVVAFAGATGCDELIAKHGVLVPDGNLGAVRAAIEKQLSLDPLDHKAADARRREIATHYNYADYCFWLLQCLDPALRRVSIIVPNYNHERYLPERLSSIFRQDYPVYELIVLDDASPDRSVEVIERAARTARRDVQLVVNSVNSGRLPQQWRKGLDLCSGDYVWISESDDVCAPTFLREAVGVLEGTGSGLCFCDSWQVDGEGNKIGSSYTSYVDDIEPGVFLRDFTMPGREFLGRFLGIKNVILNMSGVLWRRSVLEAALTAAGGEIEHLKLAADWRLYVQACLGDVSVSYIARPLNGHRRHEKGITKSLDKDAHLAEVSRMQNLVASIAPLDVHKQWLARKHIQQAREFLDLPHDPAQLTFVERDFCEKLAQELKVAPMIGDGDSAFRALLADPSFKTREQAIRQYFEEGRRSCGVIRDLLVSLRYDLKKPVNLLEFGADFGEFTRHWAQAFPTAKVTACDPRQWAVDFISGHFGIEAALSPSVPERLATGGEFDVVLAPSLFTRATPATWGHWLKALYGQVRKGGYLIFTAQSLSSARPVAGVKIPASGIWHRPEDESDAGANGSTFLDRAYAAMQVWAQLGEEISLYKPGHWTGHRDIYVVRRRES
jgi:glycosyltransferase involved in cell wall biosynthesis